MDDSDSTVFFVCFGGLEAHVGWLVVGWLVETQEMMEKRVVSNVEGSVGLGYIFGLDRQTRLCRSEYRIDKE